MKASKDQQALVDLLLDIEREFDVNSILADGIHLWPIVRLTIGRAFKSSDPITDAGLSAKVPGASLSVAASEIANGDARNADGFPRNKDERAALARQHRESIAGSQQEIPAKVAKQWKQAKNLHGTDFLILSKIEKYYEWYAGKRYAPIIDPVFEDLSARRKAHVLALAPMPIVCANTPVVFDTEPYLLSHPAPKIELPSRSKSLLHDINEYIRQRNEVYCFDEKYIQTRFRRIRHRADFYREFFRLVRPEAIFLSSFTGWMHAVLGAKEAGIPTIDIQHGGQGPIHYPSTHYSCIPSDGYAVLPDIFWVWGEMNREYAAKWLPGGASRHIPVVGGNRKVAHWYKRRDSDRLDPVDKAFLEKFTGKPNILVTLSYGVERLIPDQLLGAMKLAKNVLWHIRLHPIHRTEEAIFQIEGFMRDQGIVNFVVSDPTFVQLPTALSVSNGHVTPFSTSGTEAIAIGVPTLICDEIGAGLFREEIEAQIFDFESGPSAIAEWAERHTASADPDESQRRRYVEIRDEAIADVLQMIDNIPEMPFCDMSNIPQKNGFSLRSLFKLS